MKENRVLFISSSIPPFEESQTIRNVYFLRGLARKGFKVDVITRPADGGSAFMWDRMPGEISLFYTESPFYDTLQLIVSKFPVVILRKYLRSICAVMFGLLLAPDVRAGWSRKILSLARQIYPATPPNIVISASGSWSAHMAASELAKSWKIPWVAEYGDPWSFNPQFPARLPHIRMMNRIFESAALKHCSAITVTTEQTAAAFGKFLSSHGLNTPTITLPCGYSAEILQSASLPADESKINIAYIGTASRNSRDLSSLIRAVGAIGRKRGCNSGISLQIIGAYSAAFQRIVNAERAGNIEMKGWVSYSDSLQYILNADLLVLYGNKSQLQIPGKVYTYLLSGKPILYLPQLPLSDDPTYKVLALYPGIVTVDSGDVEGSLGKVIMQMPSLFKEAQARRSIHSLVATYDWDNIGDRFSEVVTELLAK